MLEAGAITIGIFGVACIGMLFAALGAMSCVLFGVKLRGPLLYDRDEGPYGVAFRLLAHLAVPASALLCASAFTYLLGI